MSHATVGGLACFAIWCVLVACLVIFTRSGGDPDPELAPIDCSTSPWECHVTACTYAEPINFPAT